MRMPKTNLVIFALACAIFFGTGLPLMAQSRVLGLDVSAWQANISQTTWNNIKNIENRDFVFIRSSRGGSTGFYNQSDPNNNNGLNTLSQRYDDHYFVQNITRATAAGIFAGSYHFSRPDITTNTGADEADHFIQMAGAWMRPGYLLPVHDLEAGDGARSDNSMAQFAIDFSDRVYDVMGVRPAIYTNGNYANFVIGGAATALQNQVVDRYPDLWSARWPNQSNPNSIPVQTGHPKDSYTPIYGPWDNPPNPTHPWSFWQYASTGRLNSFNNGNSNLDFNVAQGGIEFLKDKLVPAVWMTNSDGQWTTLANWNSGQPPVAPVQGPGQVARVGPLTLPVVRLPGPDDTVILDRTANVVVDLSSGDHTIRKLVARESLNISGGSLTVNYVPSSDSTPLSAQLSAPVSVTGSGSLSGHTIQVDAGQSLIFGGSMAFDTLYLQESSSAPATLSVIDDVSLSSFGGQGATIQSSTAAQGFVNLTGAYREWEVVDSPGVANDLTVEVAVDNGTLIKTGDGTLSLAVGSSYGGDVFVREGTLKFEQSDSIDDSAIVVLSANATLALDYTGSPDVVESVYLDGTALPPGTWGGPLSGATFVAPIFSGTGSILINSSQPLTGDFDDNGVVDAADFTLWRDTLGITGLDPFTGADGDGDGAVTSADYDIWSNSFGGTSVALVPESTPSWLAIIGFCGLICSRRASRRSAVATD